MELNSIYSSLQILPTMDNLRSVERDGQKFYCFIEVCVQLFPYSPKSTVRNWLKLLEISTATCSAEERTFFRGKNPALSGSFGLISHGDLVRLKDFHDTHRSPDRKRSKLVPMATTTTSPGTADSTDSKTTASESALKSLSASYISSSDDDSDGGTAKLMVPTNTISGKPESDFTCPTPTTNTAISGKPESDFTCPTPTTNTAISGKPESDFTCPTPTNSDVSTANHESKRTKRGKILAIEDTPPAFREELKDLRTFYIRALNPLRRANPFSVGTVDKMVERILGFMHFCMTIKQLTTDISLSLFNDVHLFTSYIEYLRDDRKLMPSTITNFLTVAINVVKFNLVQVDESADTDKAPQVQSFRAFQRQFQRESYQIAKRKKEGLCFTKSSQQFYFAHVLETLRHLRDKYFDSKGIAKARHLHDFVLLALYVRANPGRSKEIRTLQLYLESEKNEPFNFDKLEGGNFIVFEPGLNVVYLVQSDFKTCKTSGPSRLDISSDEELIYFLKLYLNERRSLLLGKSHDFFFVNHNGAAFPTSSAIAKYIGNVFQTEVSIRASTTALRHALVTYFCSIDESNDVNVRKSLASLMKHSMRYQEQVYNDQSHQEKTEAGRNLLRTKIAPSIFGDKDDVVSIADDADFSSDKSESEEFELKPQVGDIVALLDSASTKESILFFLAKIARFTPDRSEAHLSQLVTVDDSDNMYVLKPSAVWKESVDSLVFPVDVVYNSSKRAYVLRTSPKDIYESVHGRKS